MNTPFPEQPSTPGQFEFPQPPARRPRARNARILGSGIVLTLLLLAGVISTVLVLHSAHPSAFATGGAPTPTHPVSTTPVPGQSLPQGSLYLATTSSLSRVDLKTSKALWTIQTNSPFAPLVLGKTLFFDNENSANPSLEAASVKTGAQLWSSQRYSYGFLLGSNNELYDSFCNFSSAGSQCDLVGINTTTGEQLWSYNLPQGNAWIALQDGILYGVSYTSYFALNASTGAPIWQKDLLNYQDQEANMAPVVSGNVLSFASCNTTKQSSGFPGCYLYAFNTRTGAELWHMPTTSNLQATPAILDGVVYAGAIDGTIYAVNVQNGTQLWSVNAGGTIGQVLARTGTIYVEIINLDGQTLHVEAYNTTTHTPRWGQLSDATSATLPLVLHAPNSAGPASHPFVLEQGLIYIQSDPSTVTVLKAKDGIQVTQYTASGDTINSFTVVTP